MKLCSRPAAVVAVLVACSEAPAPEVHAPAPAATPAPPAPEPPPPAPEPVAPPAEPEFVGTYGPLPSELRAKMTGVTWKEGCPVHLDDLALVEARHWNLEGTVADGQLVVAASQAEAVVGALKKLFDARFPIHQMRPAHEFGGSDDASMAANNTSAFNCRAKTGGKSWSEHSYGQAIDINTIQNPYVRGEKVLPPEGRPYVDRDPGVPGLIVADGPVVAAFAEIGWKWGGNWRSLKDYQHFSASGK
jgi:hypothetical protein